MKYSEVKKRLREVHSAGLTKIPRLGLYERTFYLGGNMHAKISFTGNELLETHLPMHEIVNYSYEKMQRQALKQYYMEPK